MCLHHNVMARLQIMLLAYSCCGCLWLAPPPSFCTTVPCALPDQGQKILRIPQTSTESTSTDICAAFKT